MPSIEVPAAIRKITFSKKIGGELSGPRTIGWTAGSSSTGGAVAHAIMKRTGSPHARNADDRSTRSLAPRMRCSPSLRRDRFGRRKIARMRSIMFSMLPLTKGGYDDVRRAVQRGPGPGSARRIGRIVGGSHSWTRIELPVGGLHLPARDTQAFRGKSNNFGADENQRRTGRTGRRQHTSSTAAAPCRSNETRIESQVCLHSAVHSPDGTARSRFDEECERVDPLGGHDPCFEN